MWLLPTFEYIHTHELKCVSIKINNRCWRWRPLLSKRKFRLHSDSLAKSFARFGRNNKLWESLRAKSRCIDLGSPMDNKDACNCNGQPALLRFLGSQFSIALFMRTICNPNLHIKLALGHIMQNLNRKWPHKIAIRNCHTKSRWAVQHEPTKLIGSREARLAWCNGRAST